MMSNYRPFLKIVRLGNRYYSIKPLPPIPPGYINEDSAVFSSSKTPTSHTPLFSQALMGFFTKDEHAGKHFQILDMTFGAGGHTSYILDQFALHGVIGSLTVYANDCDPMAYEVANKMRIQRTYENTRLVPMKSSFKDIYGTLTSEGVEADSLSGIIIDTGVSPLQWADKKRGFCHLRNGMLDLRFDPNQDIPKAWEILQNIDDASLLRLLRKYGSLKSDAKHVASAILEARFMYYEFKTMEELYEVMQTAVKHATHVPMNEKADSKKVSEFLFKTVTALRMFVNDELNQLDYAIRVIARKFLKPELGVLAVIVHNEAEQKVVHQCLRQVSIDQSLNLEVELLEPDLQKVQEPWRIIFGEPPLPLSPGEKILNPRFKDSVMFVAQKLNRC